jgi:uncharacterized protein (TIGR01619 family)
MAEIFIAAKRLTFKCGYFDADMKIIQTLLLLTILVESLHAQDPMEDWDNYVISVKEYPVSIVVNLGLKEKAPMPGHPYLVILRTKYANPDASGFPGEAERLELNDVENELEKTLKDNNGGIYAGRFTQRGLREFYFYTLDTVDYLSACQVVMSSHPSLPWLAKALYDKNWTNYFEVLYPSDVELEKIQNRRMIKVLEEKGDNPTKARLIEHTLLFRTQGNRRSFLATLELEGFRVEEMPIEKTEPGEFPFKLVIARHEKPELLHMNRLTITLGQHAKKNNGRYESWQTQVVK